MLGELCLESVHFCLFILEVLLCTCDELIPSLDLLFLEIDIVLCLIHELLLLRQRYRL